MCFKPVKKKRRGRKGKRVRRKEELPNTEPVENPGQGYIENPGLVDDHVLVEEFAHENVGIHRPVENEIDAIPMAEEAPAGNLNIDTISYSKLTDLPLHIPHPQPNRISQTNADVEVERKERIFTHTFEAVEEEKREVVDNPAPFDLIKPTPLEPAVVDSQDFYPDKESEEKREEYKPIELPKRVEYRSPSPEIKKIVIPQMITVNVQEAGCIKAQVIATNTSDTVFELRFKIFEKTRILPTNQILVFRRRQLPLQKQLGECGIEDRSYIELTDHGKDITEYIIEITDAKTVRQLKSDLRKLEDDLKEAKKRSAEKLRQNEWTDASRLVDKARVLEVKRKKKVEELKEIHQKHTNGFRQLHVKIMRLFAEKRKSAEKYATLRRDLLVAIQKNEVLRSQKTVQNLMIQFIWHDGCLRELSLLEAIVPDMVTAAGGSLRDEGLDEPRGETKKTPPPRDLNQYEPPLKPYNERVRPIPRGQGVYGEDRYYTQDGRYGPSIASAYPEPTMGPARDQWGEGYYESQPQRHYEPQYEQAAPQFISGGEGDPGGYYR